MEIVLYDIGIRVKVEYVKFMTEFVSRWKFSYYDMNYIWTRRPHLVGVMEIIDIKYLWKFFEVSYSSLDSLY